MKIIGLAICLGTLLGTAATVGIHLYFDIPSFLFVLGGAIGFLVMKNNPERHIQNFGQGAVYFWLVRHYCRFDCIYWWPFFCMG